MKCPYKYIFGIPGEGPHSYRFLGYAVVDTLATLLLAMLTVYFTKTPLLSTFIVWFIIGEFAHYYFGVQTAVLTNIGVIACPVP
jgi:hypothetical protein